MPSVGSIVYVLMVCMCSRNGGVISGCDWEKRHVCTLYTCVQMDTTYGKEATATADAVKKVGRADGRDTLPVVILHRAQKVLVALTGLLGIRVARESKPSRSHGNIRRSTHLEWRHG